MSRTKTDTPYQIAVQIAVAAVYFGAARLGLSLAFLNASVSPVWPPTGVAIAAVLVLGYRILPAVLVGAFLANLATGLSVAAAAAIALGNTLEAATAAYLLDRFVGSRNPFNRAIDVLKFTVLVSMISTTLSATIGNISLCLGGSANWSHFWSLWLTWWLGDGTGALMVAPLFITWIEKPLEPWPLRRWAEAGANVLSLAVVSVLIFGGVLFHRTPLGHLTIPILLWAAFRLGPRGVATAIPVLSGIATWGTTRGFGPFVAGSENESLLLLQVFVAVISTTFLAVAALVAERRRAESAISFLASIVESTDDAVIGTDLEGSIISWNRGAERLYGYKAEEVIGLSVSLLMPADRTDELPQILDRIRRGESVEHFETRRLRKNGEKLDISLTVSPIGDRLGTIAATSAIGRDITERKRADAEKEESVSLLRQSEERLRAAFAQAETANRIKDEFLATISHELRTPLNAMLGWARILQTSGLGQDTEKRAVQIIYRNARAQAQLIDDLLDVSRIISGKLRLEIQPVEVAPVIQAALDVVQPMASAKGVLLELAIDPDAGRVSGDPDRLQQVFWNLMHNAVKFTPEGGSVRVSVEQVDAQVRINVSDTGQGIDPAFLPHVFDRFRQADSSTTRLHRGLGLGLGIVRSLVELHGGSVAAASGGRGKGAVFTVMLPHLAAPDTGRYRAAAASPSEFREENVTPEPSPALKGLHVLVVEDEPDARDLVALMLRRCGAEVTAVASAAEALNSMAQRRPDVLVSDIEMPGEDGYELINKIRSSEREGDRLPALALTAHAREEDRARVLEAGYQEHVAKPVTMSELASAIARLSA